MKKFLVVDDSAEIRQTYGYILAHLGWPEVAVLSAADGREAIALLEAHPDVDVILSDLEMPEVGGIELLRHCRATPALRHIPVVTMSGETGGGVGAAAIAAGACAHLVKPFELSALRRALRAALGGAG